MAAPMVSLWHAECHAVYGYVMRGMLRLQHHTGYTRRVYEEDVSDILTLIRVRVRVRVGVRVRVRVRFRVRVRVRVRD